MILNRYSVIFFQNNHFNEACVVFSIQPKEEKRHTINMEQIKEATQHVPASKMNKEVFEPTSAVDVCSIITFFSFCSCVFLQSKVFVVAINGLILLLVSGRVEENSCFIN